MAITDTERPAPISTGALLTVIGIIVGLLLAGEAAKPYILGDRLLPAMTNGLEVNVYGYGYDYRGEFDVDFDMHGAWEFGNDLLVLQKLPGGEYAVLNSVPIRPNNGDGQYVKAPYLAFAPRVEIVLAIAPYGMFDDIMALPDHPRYSMYAEGPIRVLDAASMNRVVIIRQTGYVLTFDLPNN